MCFWLGCLWYEKRLYLLDTVKSVPQGVLITVIPFLCDKCLNNFWDHHEKSVTDKYTTCLLTISNSILTGIESLPHVWQNLPYLKGGVSIKKIHAPQRQIFQEEDNQSPWVLCPVMHGGMKQSPSIVNRMTDRCKKIKNFTFRQLNNGVLLQDTLYGWHKKDYLYWTQAKVFPKGVVFESSHVRLCFQQWNEQCIL